MNRKYLPILFLIVILSLSFYTIYGVYAVNQSPTVYAVLDSSRYDFILDAYNTTISFDHNLYFTNPNVYWIWHYNNYPENTTALTLVDVWMRDLPNTEAYNITISVVNANITIHSLYQSKQIRLTAYPPDGEYFQLKISSPLGQPRYITLTYSNGETILLHTYTSNYQQHLKNILNHKPSIYYDSKSKTFMLGSPSHSPVQILISYTTESTNPPSSGGVSTSPTQNINNTIQKTIEKIRSTPPIQYLIIILIIILLALIYIYRCSIPILSKTCRI